MPLSVFASGLAHGSEFMVEDLEKGIKITYTVWKGVAYIKEDAPTCTVTDFHDHAEFQDFDYTGSKRLVFYNDQVWTRTWTQAEGYIWKLWEP